MTPIAPLIEAFLNETLTRQRGASQHTRDFICSELPVALRVRRKETEGLAVGADAGATRRWPHQFTERSSQLGVRCPSLCGCWISYRERCDRLPSIISWQRRPS